MARALTFPGQGSQAVGMGKAAGEAFGVAREVFAEVDEALSQNLSKLMWNGPEADLTLTENAQPAIMAASLAVFRVLEREGGFQLCGRCLNAFGCGAAFEEARAGDAKSGAGGGWRNGGAPRR